MNNQRPQAPQSEPLSRVQILAAMGVTALVLLLAARFWLLFDTVAVLPFRWIPQALLGGVGLGLGITLASALVYQIWPAYRRSADVYLEFVLRPLTWPDLIWLGLLPGLSEELLFRGVMLPALGLNNGAVVVSSLCFGVLHLSGLQQWPYVLWATLVGLSLGFSALATDNLLVPIAAHVVANLVSSLVWKLRQT
ncbi:MAG: CPBP family intramembrane metalloprotease [Leptolyngbyaceae cyanobacterium SM1_1_3]|nr:CPBP family intramembrane metalloprotease [Leptolyngbyaceae cyanobacterium SM1_1_3]NJM85204.1 CPBP family intramembrane metalloprotease [Leptolyngbyaceae cyanobacterium RM2_2_21]NJN04421.1 CPBP family intramembrane metalloprotease [Leptolyngbyaceae cyanobacterium RM1_1_2]NJO11658.1 CPBP family intramembrane metalloprotease [Leptolyngbyaceae cyanobacterium SL_1_1]